MLPTEDFVNQITDAYEHLYDLVYLRSHPMADILVPNPALRRKEKARLLHNGLLDVIKELDPGPQAPVFSREWRRHRLMVLHYVEGLDPQTVADKLSISRRHYYREQEAAIKAIAIILWDRSRAHLTAPVPLQIAEPETTDRLELLRREAARVAQSSRRASIDDVIRGVLTLLQDMLRQHQLEVDLALPERLPNVSIDRNLLRQILMGVLGYLIEHAHQARLRLTAQVEETEVGLSLVIEPATALCPAPETRLQQRLAAFHEIAVLSSAQILPVYAQQTLIGFNLRLPTNPQQVVLVIDDNEDILELFQRYLTPYHYRVATARTTQEGLNLSHRLQPYVIFLDLMMPGQDGWDLLQILLNQPDTRHIPIIVCSVLKQKELALLLGAAGFLDKPISEQALLSILEDLEALQV
jgi:CheY-like chemotaxis protein